MADLILLMRAPEARFEPAVPDQADALPLRASHRPVPPVRPLGGSVWGGSASLGGEVLQLLAHAWLHPTLLSAGMKAILDSLP